MKSLRHSESPFSRLEILAEGVCFEQALLRPVSERRDAQPHGLRQDQVFGRMYSETGELADGWRGSGKDRIERGLRDNRLMVFEDLMVDS